MTISLTHVAINGAIVSPPTETEHLDWLESLYQNPTTHDFEAEIGGQTAIAERSGDSWCVVLESGSAHLIVTAHKYSEKFVIADTGAGPAEHPARVLVPTELLRPGLEALAGSPSQIVEWEDAALWGTVRQAE